MKGMYVCFLHCMYVYVCLCNCVCTCVCASGPNKCLSRNKQAQHRFVFVYAWFGGGLLQMFVGFELIVSFYTRGCHICRRIAYLVTEVHCSTTSVEGT